MENAPPTPPRVTPPPPDDDFFRREIVDLYAEIRLDALLERITGRIRHWLDCAEASIFLYNPEKEELVFETATGDKAGELKKITIPRGQGVVGWIAEHGRGLIVNDCAADPRFTAAVDRTVGFVTRSLVGVPVFKEVSLLGVIEAVNKNAGDFSAADQQLLHTLASYVAIPLHNAMLFHRLMRRTREKEQLLALGQKISFSVEYQECFAVLTEILREIAAPLAVEFTVAGEERPFVTLAEAPSPSAAPPLEVVFPLQTGETGRGTLKLTLARPIGDESRNLIAGLCTFAAIAVERGEMVKRLVKEKQWKKELQIARDIQREFLDSRPLQEPDLEVVFRSIPSSEVGGDFYKVLPLDEHRVALNVSDVVGHGLPAALLLSSFCIHFDFHLRRSGDIAATLAQANDLLALTTPANRYMTVFTAMYDRSDRRLHWINAGHPAPLLRRGGEVRELPGGGQPLGMFPGIEFAPGDMELQAGDVLLLFTDGVIEAGNPAGEMFGTERLRHWLLAHDGPAVELDAALWRELRVFCGGETFADDVTFMVVRIPG